MNTQRKVLITITYNEMGIIIDTKVEEVAQPNLQPTCNQLATDTISRQALPYSIEPDGTLTVTVPKGTKRIGRILIEEDGTQYGGLFYPDEE